MTDVAKITTLSGKFMIKFFNKLKPKDFREDDFLKGFYKAYLDEKGQIETFGDITLFEFYMEYILRNTEYDINQKHVHISGLCEDIKNMMFQPDDNGNKPETTTNMSNVHKVKINREKALLVLSDFIKQSCIITNENPEDTFTKYDEEFRVATTANIIDEIKKEGILIPKAKKDVNFGRRNLMHNIWLDTEHKCKKFIDNDTLAAVLKKVYYLNGEEINLSTYRITTLPCQDASKIHSDIAPTLMKITGQPKREAREDVKTGDIESEIPIEVITTKRSGNSYRTDINLIHGSALSETLKRNKQKLPTAYICSGSQMVPGGCADQGIETNESLVYLSTSYNLCIDQAEMAFPLSCAHILVMPNILVFKDHTNDKFPMLPPNEGQKISIIMSPGIYRPDTNLVNSYQHGVDDRLYYPNAKYKNQSPIIKKYRAMLNTALFYGYDTVVLDDQGVKDFWLPAHHTASLLVQVINEFSGKFKEVIVAVNDEEIYNVYKNYIR
jgi:hypothetical protein